MGNRALIVGKGSTIGIYLHWNGGMDSVAPFLEYASYHNPQGLGEDAYDDGLATLITIVNNFMRYGSVDVVTIDTAELNDPNYSSDCDNGVYVVDGKWNIVDRIDAPQVEQDGHSYKEMMLEIDQSQPVEMQLGEDFLNAKVIPTTEAKVGMEVFKKSYVGWEKHTIQHIGNPTGEPVPNMLPNHSPYTGEYPAWNSNGYISTNTVRVVV